MPTKCRLVIIVIAIVTTVIALAVFVTIRKPTASAVQTYAQPDHVQIKHHHEFLDLLLNRTQALQSNLSLENIEQFRSSYMYFLSKISFQNARSCIQAKVNRVHAVLDQIFDDHMKDCDKLLQECQKLPQPLIFNSTCNAWVAFDRKRARLQRQHSKITTLLGITSANNRIDVRQVMEQILVDYQTQASIASPVLAIEMELGEWIKSLSLVTSEDTVLKAAEIGAQQSYVRRAKTGLTADDEAKALLLRLRTYKPLNHTDRSSRLSYFTIIHSGLDNATSLSVSPALNHQIDDQMQVTELKFLASEAVWAIRQAISNGLTRSFGDLSSTPPEYQQFVEKWNQYPEKQLFQNLLHSVEIQNAKLGQLKIILCTEEIFRFYEVRRTYDGSCWRLCACLHLQHDWNITYRSFAQEIDDEFDIKRRFQNGTDYAQRELMSTIQRLQEIESKQLTQEYCPGPSIADLRQIVRFNFLLPDDLKNLLKRIMALRTALGWGNFDFKLNLHS